MSKYNNQKMFYLFAGCIVLSLVIIGTTYAYFTAQAADDEIVKGDAATVTFGLNVEKITDIDMAFGLVPMRNNLSPKAAANMCYDDYGNAGCQMYRVTVNADSDTAMFLDGYIVMTPKEGVEVRIARLYTDDEEETFYTEFTPDDFIDTNTLSDNYLNNNEKNDLGIKTGICTNAESGLFNNTEDLDCLFTKNEQIGGSVGRQKIYYLMVWVYDNGEVQNELQGMELAYKGLVVFTTAEGNEISATFD